MSIYLGDKLLAGASEKTVILGFDLFDHKWSDHILNDISWLRADTFSWQNGEFYKSAYEHLVEDFNGTTSTTETIGSQTITYYQAEDTHKIVLPDQESVVQAIYEETGSAWYYILDVANKRFKLPRELPITDKSKGNGMTLGLTDGTINFGLINTSGYGLSLGFDKYGTDIGMESGVAINTQKTLGITTDPTKSGIISHRENTNRQQYLYFYVGNYTKSAIEQTAGITTEVLNDKLDTELGNATATTKETTVGWCMPDWSATILGNTGTDGFVAPSDGFIIFARGNSSTPASISINGSDIYPQKKLYLEGTLLVSKGDVIKDTAADSVPISFTPMKGVNNA